MVALAVDALSPTISPAAIAAAGYTAVNRYLRNLTAGEVAGYLAAGLKVGTIYETAAQEATGGAAAGTADGLHAAALAAALGQPVGSIVWVNLSDFAAAPDQIAAIGAYYQAFRAACPRYIVGGYATGYVIGQLEASQPGPWWQNAMDDQGVPGSVVVPAATMYQRVSPTVVIPGYQGQYDENAIIRPVPWWGATIPATKRRARHMFVCGDGDNVALWLVGDTPSQPGNVAHIVEPADTGIIMAAIGQAAPYGIVSVATLKNLNGGTAVLPIPPGT